MFPIEQSIQILRGVTWNGPLQWLSEDQTHKPITDVTIGLPTLVTVVAHGITSSNRFPVWITGVQGPRSLNTDDFTCVEPRWATVVDVDTLAVEFDSARLNPYVNGGVLSYNPPVDLSDYHASMKVYASIGDADPILTLDDQTNGGITLDALGNIVRTVTAEQSAALALLNGWYKLELTDSDGVVTRVAEGSVTVADQDDC